MRQILAYSLKAFSGFADDRRGAVAVMTALILSLLLLAMLGGTTVMKALSQRRELQSIAQAACNRAVKPLRLVIMDDAARQKAGQALFDQLAAERGFKINSRTVTSGWLEAAVSANATVGVVPGWGDQLAVNLAVVETCRGIPPYPKLYDVLLSSHFKTPSGGTIDLPNIHYGPEEKWGTFTAKKLGWDGGAGPGIEIQDWSNGFTTNELAAGKSYLPATTTSSFVVELDSGPLANAPAGKAAKACGVNRSGGKTPDYNSSMFKEFELHPGTYRFSLFHRARVPNNPDSTNCLEVRLEGTKPASAKQLKMVINGGDTTWKNRSFDIPVAGYGLYRLHVEAAGCGDGSGGLFNDLKLEYIRRPTPEYNDPLPSQPTDGGTPTACAFYE